MREPTDYRTLMIKSDAEGRLLDAEGSPLETVRLYPELNTTYYQVLVSPRSLSLSFDPAWKFEKVTLTLQFQPDYPGAYPRFTLMGSIIVSLLVLGYFAKMALDVGPMKAILTAPFDEQEQDEDDKEKTD